MKLILSQLGINIVDRLKGISSKEEEERQEISKEQQEERQDGA